MPETHITPEMRSAVGREFARSTSFPISDSDIRRWAVAVYYPEAPPAEFWDPTNAGTDGALITPHEFNPFAWMASSGPADTEKSEESADPDHQFTLLGVTGPGLQFQVNGGMSVTYGVPMRSGDVITSSSCIAELSERSGRLGLMLFTTIETRWTNQDGSEVKREKMTIIRY